eukprot:scaffold128033_cov46-Cyclotella_meneghiniana.AAC.2
MASELRFLGAVSLARIDTEVKIRHLFGVHPEELRGFFHGMSKAMSESFGFVSSEAGAYNDVTESTIASDYNVAASVPPAPAA